VLTIILTIAALVGLSSYVIINPGQAGVLSTLGKARDGVLLEGVHFKPPLVSNAGMATIRAKKYHEGHQSFASRVFRISKPCTIKFLRRCVIKQLITPFFDLWAIAFNERMKVSDHNFWVI
jgi:prohibitin 1